MRYNSKVYRAAIKYLCPRNSKYISRPKLTYFSRVAINLAARELGHNPTLYTGLYFKYFYDSCSRYYTKGGWYDKSRPKQALKERKIALTLMAEMIEQGDL